LTKAIEANAKSPALWNNLGAVRVRRGNTTAAIDAFQKALTMDAGFDAARANLTRATEIAALEKAAS
jgi:Tfp pilus assembly protein PilF